MVSLALLISLILYLAYVIQSQHIIPEQELEIANGASSKAIAFTLKEHNIITSKFIFNGLTRLSGSAVQLKPGLYHFSGELNMLDVLKKLKKGDVLQFKVTIPEGLRTDEMLALLASKTQTPLADWQKALTHFTGGDINEGLFLPETYQYSKPINAKALLQQMFDARLRIEDDIAQALFWDEDQILRNRIMASIVEKETALAHERVWVSAAIHNRLKLRMPLQMDPTVIYGIYRIQGAFSGNITRKDLKTDTPWNTYTNRGLPPTPICNPGAESLRAAAFPADVDYLYFVADGTGGHAFASSLEEHNANVRKWMNIERKAKR